MIEDDIAAVMAEHEHEAPTADELLAGLRSRRRSHSWLYAAAAAVLVVGVLSGVWAATGGNGKPATKVATVPLSCPAKYAERAPWVPAKPRGVAGDSRLVPNKTPKSVLMCAYPGLNGGNSRTRWALSGKHAVTGNLAGLAQELTWQPRKVSEQNIACTMVLGTQTNYLIGLTYSSGTVWVSASDEPNECVDVTNGEFTALPALGKDATHAFRSGQWPAATPVGCRSHAGRLGQDDSMVPPGAVSLTICVRRAHVIKGDFGSLVSSLNALQTVVSNGTCSPTPKRSYQLIFGYRQGPPVSVSVMDGCYPELFNGSLQAQRAGSVISIIQHLLGQH